MCITNNNKLERITKPDFELQTKQNYTFINRLIKYFC